MKKFILGFLWIVSSSFVFAQVNQRPITGAVFQSIVPDARAGGLADMGVATSSDAYSQYWNPSKYLFNKNYSGFAISYTPWLNKISNDTFLLNATFFKYLGESERSTLAASIYYFNMGEVENNTIGPTGEIVPQGSFKPNEFSIDLSYGLLLSDKLSMAVTGRFLRSDIYDNTQVGFESRKAANTFAADISAFYQTNVIQGRSFDSRVRLGANIKNIGPKLDYDSSNSSIGTALPTNLGIGAGYDFIFSDVSTLSFGLEYNKILVPMAEQYDSNADGIINNNDAYRLPDDSVVGGMFSSMFGESASTVGVSAEYKYNDVLAVRAGYKYGDEDKGDQPYVTTGIGLAFSDFEFDASYLIPTGSQDDPLANTLRFSLAWNFGGKIDSY
ncbi:MAG: type IX secretion system outer membrane channel protein PorV [Flavobacteriales bacterium]